MTETAKMYGGSLYDLAAEEGLETRILGELDEVQRFSTKPGLPAAAQHPQHPQKGALRPAGRSPAGAGPSLCAQLFKDPVRERHPAGSLAAARGLTASATMRHTASWRQRPPRLFRNDRAAEHCPAPEAGKPSPARPSTCRQRSTRRCWAASVWISTAPSWTAPCRTALSGGRDTAPEHCRSATL